ncbi:MAG: hypothetical protein OEY77_06700 [Nitrospira sp.]|nr:hypothetical protein [Nitrospira sp.]
MTIADFDVQDFEDRTRSDNKAFVRFFIRPVEDKAKSREAGRPIYSDQEYCEIIVPGNQTNRPIKPVDNIIKQRYAAQYAKWKAADRPEDFVDGTHLTEVPWLTRSQVEELAYLRIRTLEQLAVVGDDVCTRVPGLFDLKKRAKLLVQKAEEQAPILALQEQLDALKNELEVKDQTIIELAARIEELEED